ncbi:phosphonate C-P lyase system protein PhnH [Gryllotalpicola daejeonensis]|uniref:Phosphonate C-P lyase system protein PhnH n=1 Tax=Gryllotalpicola daejeonensis TaxID=993087 RepID=A0ABP7ZLX2_9MICO
MTTTAGRAPARLADSGAAIPNPGFADPTREAQAAFRALLDALAHPTRSYPLAGPAQPPAAFGPGLGAVALTVLDEDSSVWLSTPLAADAETVAWLAFHTGARVVDEPALADFAFARPAELPKLDAFRLGTDEAPHLSATLVLDVAGITHDGAARFTATGPGVNGSVEFDAPWATGIEGFGEQWAANAALFPRGVDLLLVEEGALSALPRTTRLAQASATPLANAKEN